MVAVRRAALAGVAAALVAACATPDAGVVSAGRWATTTGPGPATVPATAPATGAGESPPRVTGSVGTTTTVAGPALPPPGFDAASLAPLVADPLEGAGDASCLVIRAGGVEVAAVRADVGLIPASNAKLATAAAAVALLDPAARSRTAVVAAGGPDPAGVVGSIALVGGADRFLSTAAVLATTGPTWDGPPAPTLLDTLADAVVAAGVRRVVGDVLGDAGRLDATPVVATWKPGYRRAGIVRPISALAVDGAGAYGDPGAAAARAAQLLADLLIARGVEVTGGVRAAPAGELAPAPVELAAIEGPTLADTLGVILRESDNTAAELVLREIGRAGGDATTAGGAARVQAWLPSVGPAAATATVTDGSGLDRGNRMSCRLAADLLGSADPTGPLVTGLAVAGRSGTLERRLRDSPVAGRVQAKTGSLEGVSTLAGFLTTDSGERVVFAWFVNADGPTARAVIEQRWRPVLEALAAR